MHLDLFWKSTNKNVALPVWFLFELSLIKSHLSKFCRRRSLLFSFIVCSHVDFDTGFYFIYINKQYFRTKLLFILISSKSFYPENTKVSLFFYLNRIPN